MKKIRLLLLYLAFAAYMLTGCAGGVDSTEDTYVSETVQEASGGSTEETDTTEAADENSTAGETASEETSAATSFSISDIPAYSGAAYVEVNGNVPYFTESEYTTTSFETYSELDSQGRCGTAYACIGQDLMPTEERGAIGSVKPTGWHTVKYNGLVDGNYLYNRCHLIGYQLSGENANEKNLITGTRYLNIEGMLDFENEVADYVEATGNHVLYRVTPVFEGDNLLASGVLMEAYSVEDSGASIQFCVYCYNVQPGITIDYATGDSALASDAEEAAAEEAATAADEATDATSETQYIVNTNTGKFHYPDCSSVTDMKAQNKEYFSGSRETLIAEGYTPCGNCKP